MALGVDGELAGFGDASAGLEGVLSVALGDGLSVLAFPSLFVSEFDPLLAPSLGPFEAAASLELELEMGALLP